MIYFVEITGYVIIWKVYIYCMYTFGASARLWKATGVFKCSLHLPSVLYTTLLTPQNGVFRKSDMYKQNLYFKRICRAHMAFLEFLYVMANDISRHSLF